MSMKGNTTEESRALPNVFFPFAYICFGIQPSFIGFQNLAGKGKNLVRRFDRFCIAFFKGKHICELQISSCLRSYQRVWIDQEPTKLFTCSIGN